MIQFDNVHLRRDDPNVPSDLEQMPNLLKIDRPFVSGTGSERANNAITGAILQMASNLGLQAVAEVIETKAAAQRLLEMGCRFAAACAMTPIARKKHHGPADLNSAAIGSELLGG